MYCVKHVLCNNHNVKCNKMFCSVLNVWWIFLNSHLSHGIVCVRWESKNWWDHWIGYSMQVLGFAIMEISLFSKIFEVLNLYFWKHQGWLPALYLLSIFVNPLKFMKHNPHIMKVSHMLFIIVKLQNCNIFLNCKFWCRTFTVLTKWRYPQFTFLLDMSSCNWM